MGPSGRQHILPGILRHVFAGDLEDSGNSMVVLVNETSNIFSNLSGTKKKNEGWLPQKLERTDDTKQLEREPDTSNQTTG